MGADAYLSAIDRAAEMFPDMVLIPGCESAPYYYWSGSYFRGDLTANDHEKRLLAVGLEHAEDYERMPILHNGFSLRHVGTVLPQLMVFAGAFGIGLVLCRGNRRWHRGVGAAVCIAAVLLAVNAMPFRSSPYDPYMGDLGIAPYQRYIDTVTSAGGMVFWNYPETRSGVRPLGPIRLNTPPFPQVLVESKGYTGFAAVYGDTITVTEPGRQWDRVLTDYCRGRRQHPVWGISTADYHGEDGAGGALGNFPTMLLASEKSKRGVLEAMRAGRMYAVRGRYPQQLLLEAFSVSASGLGKKARLGEEILLPSPPEIHIAVTAKQPPAAPVKIRLIRGGSLVRTFQATLPFRKILRDEACPTGEKTYYRLDVRGPAGVLVSNPIFVTCRQAG
jgi:hypothetical protein